jgi:predicted Zn-dependent peptidase
MVISGDVETDEIKRLSEKWFGSIENTGKNLRKLPVEPMQTEERRMEVERDVPADAIYKVWHMCARTDAEYQTTDLISDVLGNGNSSRFYQNLIKDEKLFSELDAFIMGSFDKGMFVVSGKPAKGVSLAQAEEAINLQIAKLIEKPLEDNELQKVKNKIESTLVFSRMNVLDKAINLAYAEILGDANLVNLEAEKYRAVTPGNFLETATRLFKPENCSTLYYKSKN